MSDNIHCIIDGALGIYVPQKFAQNFDMPAWGVSVENAEILRVGPDHEFYWDTWDDVLRDASLTDPSGQVWELTQDSDLFAYMRE